MSEQRGSSIGLTLRFRWYSSTKQYSNTVADVDLQPGSSEAQEQSARRVMRGQEPTHHLNQVRHCPWSCSVLQVEQGFCVSFGRSATFRLLCFLVSGCYRLYFAAVCLARFHAMHKQWLRAIVSSMTAERQSSWGKIGPPACHAPSVVHIACLTSCLMVDDTQAKVDRLTK